MWLLSYLYGILNIYNISSESRSLKDFVAFMIMFVVEKCKHGHCLEKKLNLYKRIWKRMCNFSLLTEAGKLSKLERDKITVYLV